MRTVLTFGGARVSVERTQRGKWLFNAALALAVLMTVSPSFAEEPPYRSTTVVSTWI